MVYKIIYIHIVLKWTVIFYHYTKINRTKNKSTPNNSICFDLIENHFGTTNKPVPIIHKTNLSMKISSINLCRIYNIVGRGHSVCAWLFSDIFPLFITINGILYIPDTYIYIEIDRLCYLDIRSHIYRHHIYNTNPFTLFYIRVCLESGSTLWNPQLQLSYFIKT